MRKFCSIFLALVLFTLSTANAFASEINDTDVKDAVYTLSLTDAIEMAFTDNDRIIANEHKQIADEISISSAYITRKPYKNMSVNVTNNFDLYCLKEGYYIEAAQMSQRVNKMEAHKIRSAISYDVTNSYYNLVLVRKLVSAAENAYNLALTNKAIVDEQFNLGMIPRLDYDNAVLSVEAARSALDSYKLNEEIAEQTLKVTIGMDDGNAELVLTDEIEAEEYTSDVDTDTLAALDTRYDLYALKESRELAARYLDLATVLTEGSATYNTAYASYLDADYNYSSALKFTKLSIRGAYNSILTSKQSMDIAKSRYDMELREYDAAKIKYATGVISNVELTTCINDLYDAQVSYANAKLTYRMAIEKYKYEITTGL